MSEKTQIPAGSKSGNTHRFKRDYIGDIMNNELLTEFSEIFLGYGNIKSNLWFIGMEPGSPDSAELLENFFKVWVERKKPAVDDVKESHLQIGRNHYTSLFEDPVKYQRTWGGLIKILFAYEGKKDFSAEEVRSYQKEELGRLNSQHCLLELFALPAYKINPFFWNKYYKQHLQMTKEEYFEKYISMRISKLKELIKTNKPKIVVFYGASYKEYWELIAGCRIDENREIRNKKIFYRKINDTVYIISSHPVAHGITNEYLAEVGKIAAG